MADLITRPDLYLEPFHQLVILQAYLRVNLFLVLVDLIICKGDHLTTQIAEENLTKVQRSEANTRFLTARHLRRQGGKDIF